MLEELYSIHGNVVRNTPLKTRRYIFNEINWTSSALCLTGARGTGKTTLLLQYYHEKYNNVEKCLYISADNINVISKGLFNVAQRYFMFGGQALIIDEIHKYPEWSLELKNILDTYKDKKILVSGSSSLNLKKGKFDISRRMSYYDLRGLSFREYLNFEKGLTFSAYSFEEIIKNHVKIAASITAQIPVMKHFLDYLRHGYYPYFLEGKGEYLQKVGNVIEKTLFEDIVSSYNVTQPKLAILKKILWLLANTNPFVPNVDKMSRELKTSREYVYLYLEYLEMAGLIINLRPAAKGYKLIRKPGKIYLENTNLLNAITGSIKIEGETGVVRETFFVNQVYKDYKITVSDRADFCIENRFIFEIGGKSKGAGQIAGEKNACLAVSDIEIGSGNRIPLYLFGFLY